MDDSNISKKTKKVLEENNIPEAEMTNGELKELDNELSE